MFKFITALLTFGKALLALLPTTARKLGRAEANNAILTKELNNVQKANAARGAVRDGSIVQLRDPNARSD